jgi:hypothetical protein
VGYHVLARIIGSLPLITRLKSRSMPSVDAVQTEAEVPVSGSLITNH